MSLAEAVIVGWAAPESCDEVFASYASAAIAVTGGPQSADGVSKSSLPLKNREPLILRCSARLMRHGGASHE